LVQIIIESQQLPIAFNQEVTSVTYDESSKEWRVKCWNSQLQQATSYTAKSVVVATSENGTPNIPSFSNQEEFQGQVIHTSQYNHHQRFNYAKIEQVQKWRTIQRHQGPDCRFWKFRM
jgi:cation diffusion facilitator CzcD-associated flavoprotein CzcO